MKKDAEQKAKEKSSKGDANHNFALSKNKFVALFPFPKKQRIPVL